MLALPSRNVKGCVCVCVCSMLKGVWVLPKEVCARQEWVYVARKYYGYFHKQCHTNLKSTLVFFVLMHMIQNLTHKYSNLAPKRLSRKVQNLKKSLKQISKWK